MEKITPYEVLCEATRIENEGHSSLKAIEAAINYLHEYKSHLEDEDAKDIEDIIVGFDYNLRERRAEFENQTIDEILAKASEMRGEDSSHYLYWTRSAKEFLEGCEGFFTGEDAKKLSNAIARFSQDIEVAMAKIETRTVDEVLEEASRIESEGSFSSNAISDSKAFMHLYEGYFTGEDADRLGHAQSSLFQDLEAAMFRELGPREPKSEEEIREQKEMLERAGIITV
jgi:hypothetical protein